MLDILLDSNGDLSLTEDGDFKLAYSIPQAVLVRLRWIEEEWRLGPQYGFPWYTEVFIKNPDFDLIKQSIRSAIMEVDGVTGADVTVKKYSPSTRNAVFVCRIYTDTEVFVEEVVFGG